MNLLSRIALTAVSVTALFSLFSCGTAPIEHGTEYVLEVSAADTADIATAQLVVESRLEDIGLKGDFETSRDGNKIAVRVREGAVTDAKRMRSILVSSAHLTFRATYFAYEIAPTLNAAQQIYKRMNNIDTVAQPTYGLAALIALMPQNYNNTPVLFYSRAKDTAAVNAFLRIDSIAALMPTDIVFHWGRGETIEGGEQLLALLPCKTARNYVVSGDRVATAVKKEGSNGSESPEISIQFDATGTDEWARLTKANIGRSIAIEISDFAYSYPTVNSEITGGQAVVTGNFTETEADELVSILSAGNLPVQMRIVEENTF